MSFKKVSPYPYKSLPTLVPSIDVFAIDVENISAFRASVLYSSCFQFDVELEEWLRHSVQGVHQGFFLHLLQSLGLRKLTVVSLLQLS